MNLIVWKVVGDFKIKYGVNIGRTYKRIILKSMDNKEYTLNLPDNHKSVLYWNKCMKEGNIVDVSIQSNGKNVNYFNAIKLVKEV